MPDDEASEPITSQNELQQPLTNGSSLLSHPLRSLCLTINEKIQSFLQKDLPTARLRSAQAQTRHSLSTIDEALSRYPLSTLSLSYNGGKDCLVLLLLYLSALSKRKDLPASLPAIYIPPPHPFPEMDTFVISSSDHYHLSLSRHQSPKNSMKDAFSTYLSSPTGEVIEAIFVGTRRTDPHGENLQAFDVTDHGWPSFMRVHPMLEWKYVEVWAFLQYMGLEWCELYDAGFTSLGGMRDTHPNPRLRYTDDEGRERFKPAWELEEDAEERLGRD